jgi:hypothetical protein
MPLLLKSLFTENLSNFSITLSQNNYSLLII